MNTDKKGGKREGVILSETKHLVFEILRMTAMLSSGYPWLQNFLEPV